MLSRDTWSGSGVEGLVMPCTEHFGAVIFWVRKVDLIQLVGPQKSPNSCHSELCRKQGSPKSRPGCGPNLAPWVQHNITPRQQGLPRLLLSLKYAMPRLWEARKVTFLAT